MSYAPRGYAKAAIDFITEHGPSFSGPLADAIGVESNTLSALMETAVRHGFLVKERKAVGGACVNQWRLGSGKAIERPKDLEPLSLDQPAAPAPGSGITSAFALVAAPAAPQAVPASAGLPAPQPAAPREPTPISGCEFALTSAGRLLIDVDGERLALTKAQADQLAAYLDQARGVVWEGAAS